MSDGPFTSLQRSTLRALTALVSDRAKTEVELKRALEESLAAAASARSAADHRRAEREASERERIASARDAALNAAREHHARALASATRTRDTALSMLAERVESDAQAARKLCEETIWMAETLYDSQSPRPVQAYEKVKASVSGTLAQCARVEMQAAALLAMWRMPPLRPAADLDGEPPETGEVGAAALRVLLEESAARLEHLSRILLPRLFIVPLPESIAVLGGVALGVLGGWLSHWNTTGWVTGGVGGIGALVIGQWLLYRRARAACVREAARVAEHCARVRGRAKGVLAVASAEGDALLLACKQTRDTSIARAKADGQQTLDRLRTQRDQLVAQAREAFAAASRDGDAARDLALTRARDLHDAEMAALEAWAGTQAQTDGAAFELARVQASASFEREWSSLESRWHNGTRAAASTFEAQTRQALHDFPPWTDPLWSEVVRTGTIPTRTLSAPHTSRGPATSTDAIPVASDNAGTLLGVPGAMPVGFHSVSIAQMHGGGGLPSDERLALRCPSRFSLPAVVELPDLCSLLVQFGAGKGDPSVAQARAEAISLLRNSALRLLTGLPPGKVRFCFFDPVGLGQSFAAFMHLADHNEQLVGERIWTESRHLEQRLTDLTEHMENVIQKYLRNQFASIEQYNVHAGEVAEPYRFLVIADAPSGLNEAAAKRLASIISAGPRCGVYTLIAQDMRHPLPAGLMQSDLERAALRLAWKRAAGTPGGNALSTASDANAASVGRYVRVDADLNPWPFEPERPPPDEAFNAIVHAAGRAAKNAGRVEVPFSMIAPPSGASKGGMGREASGGGAANASTSELWTSDASTELRIPIGRAGATKLQHLVLGRGTAQHALIAGRTGSGKSTLLHALIVSGALWYSPRELEFYLVDFKKGVEFKTYATHRLPHARVVAVESEREFGLSVLRRLDGELRTRGDAFRAALAQDLAGFRTACPEVPMPRVLLVVDEFQELFVEDDKIAQESALLLDRLVRQGRAFGMHVVLGSQTLGGAYSLARSTIGQMGVRIALACNESDALLIMGDDNTAPRLLSRPGEAIYNDSSGAVEANNPFQVAWLDDDHRAALLQQLAQLELAHPPGTSASGTAQSDRGPGPQARELVVFEGNAPARLENNAQLAAARSATSSSSANGSTRAAGVAAPATPLVWLGEPVAIKDPTAYALRRQSGSNLLIVGQREDAALGLSLAALESLAAQGIAPHHLWLLDGTPGDAPEFGVLEARARTLLPGAHLVAYRDVPGAIKQLADEVERRTAPEIDATHATDSSPSVATSGTTSRPPTVVLLIHALQRFRALRRAEDEFDFSASADKAASADKLLATILRDGPQAGVHTLVWCDTLANVGRSLDRGALREFDGRVLMQMSSSDSSALIDSPVAGTIGANRAILHSEEQGVIEKFRPYRFEVGSPPAGSAAAR